MTKHVLTLVTLPEVFDLGPSVVQQALRAVPWLAVDIRLRGGRGPTNQARLSATHAAAWTHTLKLLIPTYRRDNPLTWPNYAEAMYACARAAGLECWGHGWLEAETIEQATKEAEVCAITSTRLGLLRWGLNAEVGVFGKQGSFRPQGVEVAAAFGMRFASRSEAIVDWMGFASLRWMYGNVTEFTPDFCAIWGLNAQMVYQTQWGGKTGAKATSERGRAIWQVQTESDCWTPLIGVGRWDDKDHDGVVDAGEVGGDPETTRQMVQFFKPTILRHYLGYGAAAQLATGNRLYPALTRLIPTLETWHEP